MVQTKSFSLRVHGREESRDKATILPGAGLWTSMLDRHLARRMAEEMNLEKEKERDAK